MAAAAVPEAAKEVFFSYAHKDSELRDELERHLSILKRSGIIQGWHDREISAGTEWAGQIHEHLERANVILLLISADFLASDYCYDLEMKTALARHESGDAIVIPVILRPVDWSGAPFAKLQCLPSRAVPVTSWANRDEAFRDVAEGIRRAILKAGRPPGTELQQRAVDAALPGRVPVGQSADLLVMVRQASSGGLKAILRVDDSYEIAEEDVRTKPFRMQFERSPEGNILPEVVTVRVESGDFDVPCTTKQIAVAPDGDSDTCVFLVSAKRPGRLQLVVEVLHEGVTVASHLLRTNGDAAALDGAPSAYLLASLPLTVYAQYAPRGFTQMFQPAPAAGPGEFTRMLGASSSAKPSSSAAGATGVYRNEEAPTGEYPVPPIPAPSPHPPQPAVSAPPAPKAASRLPIAIFLIVLAAAALLWFVLHR
ncbi:MAG: toll/interleukin-1 receptor domain-containing protein [Bryobacteraceae bacterium]